MISNNFQALVKERLNDYPNPFGKYEEPWEGFPHILRTQQFPRPVIERLVFHDTMATLFHLLNRSLISYLQGTKATIVPYFYEASTRTRMSFERAGLLLGATIIHTEAGGMFSSAVKGESLADTARVVSGIGLGIGYGDLMVVRHPQDLAVEEMAKTSRVPVINAGDGKHQHPTQAFLDLATIYLRFGKIDGLTIAMVGDICYSRTIRSLCYLLSKFERVKIYLVSPEELRVKDDIRQHLDEQSVWYREETNLNQVLPQVDIAYFTRLQAERFKDSEPELCEKLKLQIPTFSLTLQNIDSVLPTSIILHPLPIGDNEIEEKVKTDPRIWCFIQSEVGVACRMALLNRIFRELGKRNMHENFREVVFGSMRWQ